MPAESSTERVAIRAVPSFACAGVNWGVDQAKQILRREAGSVYIPNINGLVHYGPSIEELTDLGAIFVEDLEEIPYGATVANSMHGRSLVHTKTFIEKGLRHYDLSCPLVTNVQDRIRGAIEEAALVGKTAKILYACHDPVHPEPKSVLELAPSHVIPVTGREVLEEYEVRDDEAYFAESQTTINVRKAMELMMEFKHKFRGLRSLLPTSSRLGACFATDNRQQALEVLIDAGIDKLVVFGSSTSANTTQLAAIGREHNITVDFLEKADGLRRDEFDEYMKIGVAGGASVPSSVANDAMEIFRGWGFRTEDLVVGKPEPVTFPKIKPPFYDYGSGKISKEELLALTRTY